MNSGHYGFPAILGLVRATAFKAIGKAGATNGAALAGGTASGAPTAPAGPFDLGDVVVGADATLWICTTAGTSQSSPGTFTQVVAGSLSGPLATARGGTGLDASGVTDGQLLIGQSSDHTFGLAALTAGTNITVTNSGHGISIAASAGGSGDLVKIAETILGSSAASITFGSIPGTSRHLRLEVVGQTTASVTDTNLWLQVNGDTAANYNWAGLFTDNTTISESATTGTTHILVGDIIGATGPASTPGVSSTTIYDYARTAWFKATSTLLWEQYSSTHQQVQALGGLWKSTAAITSLSLAPGSGSFATGTVATLYGLG